MAPDFDFYVWFVVWVFFFPGWDAFLQAVPALPLAGGVRYVPGQRGVRDREAVCIGHEGYRAS